MENNIFISFLPFLIPSALLSVWEQFAFNKFIREYKAYHEQRGTGAATNFIKELFISQDNTDLEKARREVLKRLFVTSFIFTLSYITFISIF